MVSLPLPLRCLHIQVLPLATVAFIRHMCAKHVSQQRVYDPPLIWSSLPFRLRFPYPACTSSPSRAPLVWHLLQPQPAWSARWEVHPGVRFTLHLLKHGRSDAHYTAIATALRPGLPHLDISCWVGNRVFQFWYGTWSLLMLTLRHLAVSYITIIKVLPQWLWAWCYQFIFAHSSLIDSCF